MINKIYLCYTKDTLRALEYLFLTSKFLSGDELAIANTLKDESQRCTYIQSNAFKRKILSKYLNVSPAEIKFYTNQYGKPFLVTRWDTGPLFFNLSHTMGATALIVGSYENTGIDIEKVTDRNDITLLQNTLLHPYEMSTASAIKDSSLQKENFFKIWVIKECFLKSAGLGLSLEPSHIRVENCGEDFFRIIAADGTIQTALIEYQQFGDFALSYTNPERDNCGIETFIFTEDFARY